MAVKTHAKNTVSLLAAGIGAKLLQLVTASLIIKALPVAQNDAFQLGITFGFVLAMFTEFGVRGYVVREMSRLRTDRDAAQRLLFDAMNARFILVGVVTPVALMLLYAVHLSHAVIVCTLWMLVYAVLDSFAVLLRAVLRAYERMEFESAFSIIGRGVILALVMLAIRTKGLGVNFAILAHLMGSLVECVGLLIVVKHVLGLSAFGRSTLAASKWILYKSMPFAVLVVIGTLYMRTGSFLLTKMRGEVEAGPFLVASRLPDATSFLPLALVNALIPALSRAKNDRKKINHYFEFLMRYLGFAGIIISAVFVIEARWIILTFSKAEYLNAVPVFRWYGAWVTLTFLEYVMANLLICLDHEKLVMRRYTLALIVNIVLNLVLIRMYGLTGAAIALFFSELTAMLIDVTMVVSHKIRFDLRIPGEIVLVGGVAVVALLLLSALHPILRIAGAVVASGALAAVFAWNKDRDVLLRLISKWRPVPATPVVPTAPEE